MKKNLCLASKSFEMEWIGTFFLLQLQGIVFKKDSKICSRSSNPIPMDENSFRVILNINIILILEIQGASRPSF